MPIATRTKRGVLILEPGGRLTIGKGEVELDRAVEEFVETDAPQILVNLREVEVIDSSGIGSLVAAYSRAQARGGAVKLVHLPAKIQDVVHIAQLHRIFEIFDDERTAIESFDTASGQGPAPGS
jgi:anti-sigma B factor antagonist